MTRWSLLLCEGSHDREFLCSLASCAHGWRPIKKPPPDVLPVLGGSDKYRYLLVRDSDVLVIAGLDGVDNVIGRPGRALIDNAKTAMSIGVLVDADNVGIAARQQAARQCFASVLPSAFGAVVGAVMSPPSDGSSDGRSFGLWVAPDCHRPGSLDDVIRQAADALHPSLTPIADGFIRELGNAASHT